MSNPYRAMCAELLAAIQLYTKLNPAASDMSPFELTEKLMDAMAATDAALAQPVAEGPTVMEIIELHSWLEDEWRANNDGEDLPTLDFARAVLAKWGRPTLQPVVLPSEQS